MQRHRILVPQVPSVASNAAAEPMGEAETLELAHRLLGLGGKP